jgi:hypothetical protein
MTRHTCLAALAAIVVAFGASPAAALMAGAPGSASESAEPGPSAQSAGAGLYEPVPNLGFSSLRNIANIERIWASAEDANANAGDLAFGVPSPAAQTDSWALVPEPAGWMILLQGAGAVGAMLRARRRSGSPGWLLR